MKTFRRLREHARGRPLLRPEANLRENSFVAPHKFTERTAITLRMNLSGENFDPRNPGLADLLLAPVGGGELTCFDSYVGEQLRKGLRAVVTRDERGACFLAQSLPGLFVVLAHVDLTADLLNEKSIRLRGRFAHG